MVEKQYVALAKIKQSSSKSHDGYIVTDFLSDELQSKITDYFSCYFYPTNKLYDMVENNFLDLEGQEKRAEEIKQNELEDKQRKLEQTQIKQFWITTIIAVISFISSVAAIIVPIVNEKKYGNEKQKIELYVSEENSTKLSIIIDRAEPITVDVDNVLHIEEDNPKKIPIDVNINYPKTL